MNGQAARSTRRIPAYQVIVEMVGRAVLGEPHRIRLTRRVRPTLRSRRSATLPAAARRDASPHRPCISPCQRTGFSPHRNFISRETHSTYRKTDQKHRPNDQPKQLRIHSPLRMDASLAHHRGEGKGGLEIWRISRQADGRWIARPLGNITTSGSWHFAGRSRGMFLQFIISLLTLEPGFLPAPHRIAVAQRVISNPSRGSTSSVAYYYSAFNGDNEKSQKVETVGK